MPYRSSNQHPRDEHRTSRFHPPSFLCAHYLYIYCLYAMKEPIAIFPETESRGVGTLVKENPNKGRDLDLAVGVRKN